MRPGRWVQIVALLTAGLCVAGSAFLVKPINDRRVDLQIVQETRYGDAPKYALLAASMGTFRGLAADFLWYRAEKLKSEGKLFEANTTAAWITTLQPKFGQVWVFQSWNMAYNISVITHTPEERWDWVNKGIKLLRDEGIVYNPDNIAIYRQLGWTFFHKIGQRADDMNLYYKARLALEWQELLGTPTEGADKELALQRFKPIADAAEHYFSMDPGEDAPREPLSQLYEDHPQVRELVTELRLIGYQPDLGCLREMGRIFTFERYADPRELAGPDGPFLDARGRLLYNLLKDARFKEALESLINFMQARVLIEDYHMEPERMYRLMEKFGPLDWRHAGSHAIYWGATGVEKAGELRDKTKIDVLNTDRQIIHGLQMLMHAGTISFNPMRMRFDTVPDPRFIDAYGEAMVEANNRQMSIDWAGNGNETSFQQGHENFLLRAVLYAYLYGDIEKSNGYYKQLRDLYGQKPHNVNHITGVSRYTVPLRDLIAAEIMMDWEMTDQVARPWMESLLFSAFQKGLARGDYRTFERFLTTAREVEKQLTKNRGYDNAIAPGGKGRLINWNSFDELLGNTYAKFLMSPNTDLLERAQVYRNSPPHFQTAAYPRIIRAISDQARAIGYGNSIDRMFPPPPQPEGEDPSPQQAPGEVQGLEGQGTIQRQ